MLRYPKHFQFTIEQTGNKPWRDAIEVLPMLRQQCLVIYFCCMRNHQNAPDRCVGLSQYAFLRPVAEIFVVFNESCLREGEVGAAASLKAYDDLPVSWDMEAYGDAKRAEMPVQDAVIRRTNWQEVELGFSEAVCREECKWCLRCDLE